MRPIDADELKRCYTGSNGLDNKADYMSIRKMIDNQPTIEPSKWNKAYTLGILADIMAQANYMITLENGSQKLCVDTAIIDKIMDEIKCEVEEEKEVEL